MNDRLAEIAAGKPPARLRDHVGGIAFPDAQADVSADAILASISDGIVALDNEWRLVYANPAAQRIWGRDLGPLIGKSLHDSLDIAPDNPFRLAYMISKNNGEPIAFTGYSEVFAAWVDVRGYPHRDGYTILFRAVTPDKPVSNRTAESEREREATRSINQRIFDTSLDLILVVDQRGDFLRVSLSSGGILGYAPDNMIRRTARAFEHTDDLEVV